MNFRTKSLVVVAIVLGIMIVVAITVNNVGSPTARTVGCECENDADCDDWDACTEDSCLYPENCAASRCINKKIC